MPVARSNLPQINAGQALYGAIPIELLPNGTAPGQIPYWDGTQWHLVTLVASAGTDIDFDVAASTLAFVNTDYRVTDTLTSDAILLATRSSSATANAVLLATVGASATADAVLV